MWTLLKKELAGFFSSLTGYVVIIVFLAANSLFIWVFPGDYNVLDSGYANLDTLFFMAPWIFLFLVPALTMRMFAEEKRAGTIELLYTHPIGKLEIIFAKFFAGILLVLFSLLPTLVYFLTVVWLGKPVGNIDTGAIWGSYIGLFFLASIYVAIGIFGSALTENQIVAFTVSMILSFFIYMGFDAVSGLEIWGHSGDIVEKLGINAHYKSLSRGVIDTRDVAYFLTVSALFIVITKTVIEKKK
jgi:ABC-2 type transport system permease protein